MSLKSYYAKRHVYRHKFMEAISKEIDIIASKKYNVKGIQTVCLFLGPLRNLTTLTASILFLHPHCQVLNHGGRRIFGDRRLDFFLNYTNRKFHTFTKYATYLSEKPRRGRYGGSVTWSHAFDDKHKMQEVYKARFGDNLVKNQSKALVWKESLRVSNHIRNNHVNLNNILYINNKLKFILPLRNPLDCAVSNLRTGRAGLFTSIQCEQASPEQMVEAVLDEILWFINLKKQHEKRFFYFFEHEFCSHTLFEIANFLGLEADEQWYHDSLKVFEVKRSYDHSYHLIEFYRLQVKAKFSNHADFSNKLLRFVES